MHLVTSCAQVEHDQHLEGGREGEAGGEHAGRLHRLQEHGAPGGGCAGAELHAIVCYMDQRDGDAAENLNIWSSCGAAEYSLVFQTVLPAG